MRAVAYVASNLAGFGRDPEIQLVNAQPHLPGRAASMVGGSMVRDFYEEQSVKALSAARRALSRRDIAFKEVHLVGDPGTAIANYATSGKFSMVIMGSRGHGAVSNLVLGSVVQKVIAACKVPLLIIR
jgi:nucleotide-binding universal stress UspA family protein